MTILNPASLLQRLAAEPSEAEWLEFKVNNCDPENIGRLVSACSNGAILSGSDRAFIVFGVEDKTRRMVGTKVHLSTATKGAQSLESWLVQNTDPRPIIEIQDFDYEGLKFSILSIEATYDRPVKFLGKAYIRIGDNVKSLSDHHEHERSLWLATGKRKFENAIALRHQAAEVIPGLLDVESYYRLARVGVNVPLDETLRRFCGESLLLDNMEGTFDVTNLGALLFAKDLKNFPHLLAKSIRVVRYSGRDKRKSDREMIGQRGYAVGFSGLIRYIMECLPTEERYINGVRSLDSLYSETAIREVVANALIHQDFTVTGAGPTIEIYNDRVEITNPGNSLIEIDRIIDERRSRNEMLATKMRLMGLCEERGGGLDKSIMDIERLRLPAPDFVSSSDSMRVILFGPKPFSTLSKVERQRACFYHCVIRWIVSDPMSNTTLRERFSLHDNEYQAASSIISDALRAGRIVPVEENQGRRNARYVPYWVATLSR